MDTSNADWASLARDLWPDGLVLLRTVRDLGGTDAIIDFECRFANLEASAILRRPPSELVGGRLLALIPGKQGHQLFEHLRTVLETGLPVSTDLVLGDPAGRWRRSCQIHAGRVGDGVAVSIREAADRPGAHLSLPYLAAIVESSDDAIISKTLDGRITSWNGAASRLFGYRASEAIGRPITLIIPLDRRAEEDTILARIRIGEPVDHFETVRQRKDGTLVDVSITISPVRDVDGVIIGASKIARDITDRKRLDDTLRRQADDLVEANRMKDEFLMTLSHELRTPLNAILGWSQILQDGRLDPGAREAALEAVARNARAQMQIVNDVLDVSRIVTGQLRLRVAPVDVVPVLRAAFDAIGPAAAAKHIALASSSNVEPALVLGDRDRLLQVFWNLCSNAVKFTPGGGRVQATVNREGDDIVIRVTDTGVGISAQYLPRLFSRFSQSDGSLTRFHGGLGVGLAIVRHLVEMHGGNVEATSAGEGRGATFVVRLPAHVASAEAREDRPAAQPATAERHPVRHRAATGPASR